MLRRITGCFAVVVVSTTSLAFGADQPSAEKEYPPPPWHLVDLRWDLGQEQPFESYSIDVEISDDVLHRANRPTRG